MSDKAKEERALRTISVSSRAALRRAEDGRERDQLKNRTDELLLDLEEHVRQDGNDPEILQAIEDQRQETSNAD